MPNKVLYTPPELLTADHDVTAFACGEPALNRFIKRYALINQANEISRTYVTTRDGYVAGFYTLAFGSISHEDATAKIKAELPQYPIPIILLARLAVDLREKGRGLGKALLRDALLRSLQASDIAGLRAVLTHAKNDEAKNFYLKFGFEPSPTHDQHLMLSIRDLKENMI